MGYTTTRSIIRWWNHKTNKIRHTITVRFNENKCFNEDNDTSPNSWKKSIKESDPVLSSERLNYEYINTTDNNFIDS